MAGNRDAAGTRPQTSPCRRAGRRDDAETRQTTELLKEINRERTVVVVEHDMAFVRDLDVKVTCLHEGSVLAEGTIDQVSANERVVEVYLGR
jgi:urea transport system ATP-binding protein